MPDNTRASALPPAPLGNPEHAELVRYGKLLDELGIAMLVLASPTDSPTMLNRLATEWLNDALLFSPTGSPLELAALGSETATKPALTLQLRDAAGGTRILKCQKITLDEDSKHQLLTLRESGLPAADSVTDSPLAPESGMCSTPHLQALLDNEIHRARRYGTPFSLAVIEVDAFTEICSQHGASTGNRLLAELGRLLRSTLREIDIVGPGSTGEFVLILPNIGADDALLGLERLRGIIKNQPLSEAGLFITLSGGIAEYANETAPALIERTHLLLDQARSGGRNRFCLDADLF